jgi:hypothetical protein
VRAYLPPRSAMGVILEIDRLLREAGSVPRTSIARQLHDIALMMRRRSFVILISDLFSDVDDIISGLDHLRHDGHSVVVLHTLDPYELEFPFKGTWRFDGLEGEDPITSQPERIRKDYLANLNEYMAALKAGCVASHVDYTMIDTSRPLDAVLSEFFHLRESALSGPSSIRP